MTDKLRRYGALAGVMIAMTVGLGWRASKEPVNVKTPAGSAGVGAGPQLKTTASALRIRGKAWNGSASEITDPKHPFWASAPALPILLNHTPRIYSTDKIDRAAPPAASVSCAEASDGTVVHMAWVDAVEDRPSIRKPSPADAAGSVKVVHSQKTNRFYDAAAVMVPVDRHPKSNPCIQMGDAAGPVEIYLWNSVRGPVVMKASGRATTERTKRIFAAKAVHGTDGWHVTFVLPKLPENAPISFAIWDGSKDQRGGLKYYSLWHILN